MYERFTDRARKVMQLANQEALRFNHEYIGTEHILLGLIAEGSGVAANVLKNLDIDLLKVRREIEKIVQPGPDLVEISRLPQTPRAKKVIEDAIEESHNLGHNYVGTEHLLLGLIREQEGVAAQVLMNLGLDLKTLRDEVKVLLGHNGLPTTDVLELPKPIVSTKSETPDLPKPAGKILAEFDWQIDILQESMQEAIAGQDFFKAGVALELHDTLKKLRADFLRAWSKPE